LLIPVFKLVSRWALTGQLVDSVDLADSHAKGQEQKAAGFTPQTETRMKIAF
jgi:hypothetical protein